MGVHKLFPNISNKYKNNVIFTLNSINDSSQSKINNLHELFLDANCLLHPVSMKVYSEHKSLFITNLPKLEFMMIEENIKYIEMLISLTKPSELVYIAIDGVAPFAKNKQQYCRRYKSVHDNNMTKKFANKYNIPYEKPWNNSAITPGTAFMDKIVNGVIQYLMIKQEQNKDNSHKIKYIFSSAYTPNEGEHKILQYIRSNKLSVKNRAIYGLDADLIYLSMASNVESIFLMREITQFQHITSPDGFCFLSIDNLIIGIYDDITKELVDDGYVVFPNLINYKSSIIMDYIFYGFMIGNDFLSNLPSVNLKFDKKHSGLSILNDAYRYSFSIINQGKSENYIFLSSANEEFKINYDFLKEMLVYIVSFEESYFRDTFRFKKKIITKPTTFEEEVKSYENMEFYVADQFHLGHKATPHEESKKLYYEYYGMQDINKVCEEYIGGLAWNGHYYFNECQDFLWHYPYDKSPFVSDILEWLLSHREKFDEILNKYPLIKCNMGTISPLEQLLLVLPVQSAYLLPRQIKSKMLSNPDIFLTKFDLDLQDVHRMWQAKPKIPPPNIETCKSIIQNISLNNDELLRNTHRKIYEFMI